MSFKNKKTLICDLILVVPILVIALFFLIVSMKNVKKGSFAVVKINGQVVARYSLSIDAEYILNNGTNTLVIKDGYAMIIGSNCPDKTCEKQGRINLQGQTIVCLPNRLIVTIEQEQGGVDLVI